MTTTTTTSMTSLLMQPIAESLFVALNGVIINTANGESFCACINLSGSFCECSPVVLTWTTKTFPEIYHSLFARLNNKIWLGLDLSTFTDAIRALCERHNLATPRSGQLVDLRSISGDASSTLSDFAEQFQLPAYRSNHPLGGCHIIIDTLRNYGAIVYLHSIRRPYLAANSGVAVDSALLQSLPEENNTPNEAADPNFSLTEPFFRDDTFGSSTILDEEPPHTTAPPTSTSTTTITTKAEKPRQEQQQPKSPPQQQQHQPLATREQSPPQRESPQPRSPPPEIILEAVVGETEETLHDDDDEPSYDVEEPEFEDGELKGMDSPLRNGKDVEVKETEDPYFPTRFSDDLEDEETLMGSVEEPGSRPQPLTSTAFTSETTSPMQGNTITLSGNGVTKHSVGSTPSNLSVEDDVSQTDMNVNEEDEVPIARTKWSHLVGSSSSGEGVRKIGVKVGKAPIVPTRRTKNGPSNGAPNYYKRNIITTNQSQIRKVIDDVIAINSRLVPPGRDPTKIDLNIVNKLRCIWISYDGHSRPFEPRGIHPVQWDRRPGKENEPAFYAIPFKSKSGRHSRFVLECVCEIRGQSWTAKPRRGGGRLGRGERSGPPPRAATSPTTDSAPPRRQPNFSVS